MIREMIKRWWMQLKTATNKGVEPEWQRCSRYFLIGLYEVRFRQAKRNYANAT